MVKKIILTSSLILTLFASAVSQTGNRQLTLRDTIRDNAIKVPHELERNLEQLLVDWQQNYRENPNCQQSYSDAISYPDSTYIKRLYSLPSEMELGYNQIVRSYIDMYASRRRKSVEYMLAKGQYYFPIIEEILDKNNLPLELKYLPIIESALNPIAKSPMGATGLWQFMLPTGKMYDLEVNTLVDERKDPIKSSEAAARYLKDLYDIYGDWNLVIAAYNCGPGNVNKAIRRSGGLTDYWAIYPYLPRETRGYVPAFIAATYIMNYYPEHNICPMEETYPVSVDTLWIEKNLHLTQISETLKYPLEDIRSLNPQYQKDIIPGDFKKYALRLPSKTVSEFIRNEEDIYNYKSQELFSHRKIIEVNNASVSSLGKPTKTHKVKRGESLGSISRRYGVSLAQLKKLNNLKSNKLAAGKNLIISRQAIAKQTKPPVKEEKILAENKEEKAVEETQASASETNTESGDFFANYYKKKNEENAAINEADSTNTQLASHENEKKEILFRNNNEDVRTIYHKVKIGETVLQIANKYSVSTKEILTWNKMSSKKTKIGQRLMIKLPEKVVIAMTEKKEEEEQKQIALVPEKEDIKPAPEVQTQKKAPKKKSQSVYRVRKGDSLSIIAGKYRGVSAKDIMLANKLKNDKLSVGQRLNIPSN